MKSKSIMCCIILTPLFLLLGLVCTPNIMAQSCSPGNYVIITPSPTTVNTGEEIVWTISILNNSQSNDPPFAKVPARLVADGSDSFHLPLKLKMAAGRPKTFKALEALGDGFGDDDGICEVGERCNCTDMAAGMDYCEIDPFNSNTVLLYTTAEGVAFTAEETITIGKVHATAVKPVPIPSHVATTKIIGAYNALVAKGVFKTTDPLCSPQIYSGIWGTTTEFFPPPLIVDIKANDSDGPVTITTNDVLTITVSLSPSSHTGEIANWYEVSYTPLSAGWYHYEHASVSWKPGFGLAHRGPLLELSPSIVLQRSGLPVGEYIFFFHIGLDTGQLYSDSVKVNVN